ncbi:hypothetical protein QQ73_15830 [Candidatus Endoriftia persephone str. Guaymas]|nr:hypothetical protein [Candidatus Endoriftia persephone str. Guaymas]
MTEIQIGGRVIGRHQPPFIIAETGINHCGDLERAFKMIRAARQVGADAVKFQTFQAEEFCSDPQQTYSYRSQGREVTESMLEMFRRHQFEPEQWRQICDCCDEEGIIFLSTPQNRSDLDLLLELEIPAIKVGSDDFTNLPQLRDYASTGLPMIVSAGMADLDEVEQALRAIGTFKGHPTVLLHCVSQYPAPPEDANLRKLTSLRREYPELILGYSDHTQGVLGAVLAVAFGARVFEKHFTLDHDLPGPDHWFSADIGELQQWVEAIRQAHRMLGSEAVEPTAVERKHRDAFRRSVVAIRNISKNEPFSPENLGVRRPGSGLKPNHMDAFFGHRATRTIAAGELIHWSDREGNWVD